MKTLRNTLAVILLASTAIADFVVHPDNRPVVNWTGTQAYSKNVIYTNTFWDDLRFPAVVAAGPGGSAQVTVDTGTNAVKFTNSASVSNVSEMVFGIAQMSHAYKFASDIEPHVHFLQTAASQTNNWYLHYKCAAIRADIPATWTVVGPAENQFAWTGNAMHQYADFPFISCPGFTNVSSMVLWRLSRDGDNDTYNGDMFLFEFDIHYELDQPGSQEETSK